MMMMTPHSFHYPHRSEAGSQNEKKARKDSANDCCATANLARIRGRGGCMVVPSCRDTVLLRGDDDDDDDDDGARTMRIA